MKEVWKHYLRDDGLVFREFNGTIQYWCLGDWHTSFLARDLTGEKFEPITSAKAKKIIADC